AMVVEGAAALADDVCHVHDEHATGDGQHVGQRARRHRPRESAVVESYRHPADISFPGLEVTQRTSGASGDAPQQTASQGRRSLRPDTMHKKSSAYSFTAPAARPRTICRSAKMISSTGGIQLIVQAASMRPHSSCPPMPI